VNDISLDAAKIGNFPHINQLRARKLSSEEEKKCHRPLEMENRLIRNVNPLRISRVFQLFLMQLFSKKVLRLNRPRTALRIKGNYGMAR